MTNFGSTMPTDSWIEAFQERNGRAPSVLHIGNIANNAYLNASILNRAGVDCDVLCYDYYHVMGCPEWESAVFEPDALDQFRPRWSEVDLHGFERPRWFAQGLLNTCLNYLIARRSRSETEKLWDRLARERDDPPDISSLALNHPLPDIGLHPDELVSAFQADFPLRADRLSRQELAASLGFSHLYFDRLRHLLSLYDLVVGYSVDGIIPLSVGKRPYFTYEHGTIRTLPFEATPAGRLCALAYSRADVTFITNCDTVIAAEKLRLTDYRFVPHPINEEAPVEPGAASLRRELREKLDADFIAFHPARQHWDAERNPNWEKANDIFLEGFARFVKTARPRAAAILIDWGSKVEQSKALINRLGISDRVAWVPPQNAARLASYIKASDVLADQFFLGAWGSTMPRALYFGTPAMLYVNESIHRWCFPEMPPVVNARSSEDVYTGLCRLLDEDYRRDLAARARAWYERYHSNRVIAERFIRAMQDALAPTRERRTYDLVRGLGDAQRTTMSTISQDIRTAQLATMSAYQEGQSDVMEGQSTLIQGQSALMEGQSTFLSAHERSSQELQAAIAAVTRDLQDARRQLSSALEVLSELKPILPMLQRTALVARLLLGPPYRIGRFLYRLLTRVHASDHG
jgi:glycosyltransferase involved in cell wall biosynthesis